MNRDAGTGPTGAAEVQGGGRGHVPSLARHGEPDFRIETQGTLDAVAPAAFHFSDSIDDELRDLLGAAFERLALGAIVIGLDGRFLHVNPAICRMLGRSADELRSHRIDDYVEVGELAAMRELGASIVEGRIDGYREQRAFVRPDGRRLLLDVTGSVLKSGAGRPRGVLAVCSEVSEVPAAVAPRDPLTKVEALAQEGSVEGGAELREELDSFFRTVAQEFRIPLRIIEGYADIVVEDCGATLDRAAHRYMQTIREQSRRLSALIDDTLSLARIASRPIVREVLDLSAIAAEAAAVVRAETHAHDVDVRVDPGLVASADAALVARAMKALFENAFRFSRAAAQPRVEFGRSDVDGAVAYFVRDNGSGFDTAGAGRLFLPFETLHEGSEAAGTGVGLAEVNRIVSRHGGRVWAESAPGCGATFYFTLPAELSAVSSNP